MHGFYKLQVVTAVHFASNLFKNYHHTITQQLMLYIYLELFDPDFQKVIKQIQHKEILHMHIHGIHMHVYLTWFFNSL